jgi:hypothetical protein
MEYREPKQLTKTEAEEVFAAESDLHALREALVSVALGEEDWRWVQGKCLHFAAHEDPSVRSIAATCLGHVARIHRKLDLDVVMPTLEGLLKDPETEGFAEMALDDIRMFVR